MSARIRVFGDHDEGTMQQIVRCAEAGDAPAAVLCADGHLGYSQPIGGAIAYVDQVSPSGVGYDIGCGNKAMLTDLTTEAVVDQGALPFLANEIDRRISFGVGRKNNEPVDHAVLDRIRTAEFEPQRQLLDLAAQQLGTVGAGNHYVDLFADEQDRVWIGVHFGSRGFGHKTASGFLALAQGLAFGDKANEGDMHAPPTLLPADAELGQAYVSAMTLAGEYAYAGRDVVCEKVLEILEARSVDEVHNHHNYAWKETHLDGTHEFDAWVVRKGCTPAFPGQRGFVGASMGGDAVILEGVDSGDSADALYSTVHGAGRAMSRTEAAGKMANVYQCSDRDCEFWVPRHEYARERERRGLAQHERFTLCPKHPNGKMRKQRVRTKTGAIDFDAVKRELTAAGIVLRGGAADEAPGAYKRLPEVLAHHEGTVKVLHTLRPLVVVMAGSDTFDPYKD